jgi:very-short-patch-repair endonuclease
MTLPEVLLWQELRKKPNGIQYRRQHPAGRYVLDFFCAPSNLAIEIDGEVHSRGDQPARDETCDLWLERQGIRVLRIPAAEVLKNLDAVVQLITAATSDR